MNAWELGYEAALEGRSTAFIAESFNHTAYTWRQKSSWLEGHEAGEQARSEQESLRAASLNDMLSEGGW